MAVWISRKALNCLPLIGAGERPRLGGRVRSGTGSDVSDVKTPATRRCYRSRARRIYAPVQMSTGEFICVECKTVHFSSFLPPFVNLNPGPGQSERYGPGCCYQRQDSPGLERAAWFYNGADC